MIAAKNKEAIPVETKKHNAMWRFGTIFFTPKPIQNEVSMNALRTAIATAPQSIRAIISSKLQT